MTTILVWLLLTSYGSGNWNSRVMERFPTAEACKHVQVNIPKGDYVSSRCVQAEILVPK